MDRVHRKELLLRTVVAEIVGDSLADAVMSAVLGGRYLLEPKGWAMPIRCHDLETAVVVAAGVKYADNEISNHLLVELVAIVYGIKVTVTKSYPCRFISGQSFCLGFEDMEAAAPAACLLYGKREEGHYVFSRPNGVLMAGI